jgi:hypothetical protein
MTNTSLAALAQPAPTAVDCSAFHFEIANPAPGSRLDPGDYVLQGIAQDTRALEGAGIERIDFFIGDRDAGGVIVGRVIPGALERPFGPNSFKTKITVPNLVGGRELFGYARSAVADQEVIISMPLALGLEPGQLDNLMTTPRHVTCAPQAPAGPPATVEVEGVAVAQMPEAAPEEAAAEPVSEMALAELTPVAPEDAVAPEDTVASEEAAAPEEAAVPEVAGATAESSASEETADPEQAEMPQASPEPEEPRPLAANARMFFNVGNPSPGDDVHVGDVMIEGMAFDRAAEQGHGIMRVDVFLEDRDTGGIFIGQAQLGMPNPAPEEPQLSNAGWRARVTIPSIMGPRTMFFYAHSDTTGGEMVVKIPITIVQ